MPDTQPLRSSAHIATDRPERYVKQLVSHLGRKLTTSVTDDGVGTITFPDGQCVLSSHPGFIDAQASGADAQTLAVVEDVVARHLVRFGSPGELSVTWRPTADGGAASAPSSRPASHPA
ncbi:MAG: DUF2218 domain-containing protein [Dermatophilaceae bacterium]